MGGQSFRARCLEQKVGAIAAHPHCGLQSRWRIGECPHESWQPSGWGLEEAPQWTLLTAWWIYTTQGAKEAFNNKKHFVEPEEDRQKKCGIFYFHVFSNTPGPWPHVNNTKRPECAVKGMLSVSSLVLSYPMVLGSWPKEVTSHLHCHGIRWLSWELRSAGGRLSDFEVSNQRGWMGLTKWGAMKFTIALKHGHKWIQFGLPLKQDPNPQFSERCSFGQEPDGYGVISLLDSHQKAKKFASPLSNALGVTVGSLHGEVQVLTPPEDGRYIVKKFLGHWGFLMFYHVFRPAWEHVPCSYWAIIAIMKRFLNNCWQKNEFPLFSDV